MSRRSQYNRIRDFQDYFEDFEDELDDYDDPFVHNPMYPMMRPPVMMPLMWWNTPVFFGFNPLWASQMSWLQTRPNVYGVWRRYQDDIRTLNLSCSERRQRLQEALTSSGGITSRSEANEMVDRLLGMEDKLGADQYGHVETMTSATTTTSSSGITQPQRQQFANQFLQKLRTEATRIGQKESMQLYQAILNGEQDDLVQKQAQTPQAGVVQPQAQAQLPAPQPQLALPAPPQSSQQYDATSTLQQYNTASTSQQYPPAPQPQYTAPAPPPQQYTPVQAAQVYAPSPGPVNPQGQSGHQLISHTTTTTTNTTTSAAAGQHIQSQPSTSGAYQQPSQTYAPQPYLQLPNSPPPQQIGYQQQQQYHLLPNSPPPQQIDYQQQHQIAAGSYQPPVTPNQQVNQGQQYRQPTNQASLQLPDM
ncbi:hypothetical protein LTR37_008199 [Vermiconidia calcicola]|uniref:Uncharacterized protein n=1 Tax=Vermiconidia calcicola TaxID=1690605 RepID=A0ACC3NCQ6_9PEZI|nr:hypothetical protein LTR37_008199 [Vermiconidia calcicola]